MSKTKILEARADILQMYTDEKDGGEWVVAWSGGKDSTAVLGLVTSVIKALPADNRKRKIHVVMSDTRIENPILGAYMHDQVTKFNAYAAKHDLPMEAQIVARPIEKSYFVLTLGRGYFLPQRNGLGRWCTDRLKITPSNDAIAEVNPSYKVVGTRTSESSAREASINKHRLEHKIATDAASSESRMFMPIVDWTADDVWAYLGENSLGWTSTREVRQLYKDATGECGLSRPANVERKAKEMEACGARFGCWLCPVVANDRSTEEMAKVHAWMEPLTEWRETQMKVYGEYTPIKPEGQSRKDRSADLRKWEAVNEQVKLITKSGYNRAGKRMPDGQGTFTLEARKWLFERLVDTQNLVNRLRAYEGLPAIELISAEEIRLIFDLWSEDERDYPLLLTNAAGHSIGKLGDLVEGIIAEELVEAYIERRTAKRKRKKEGGE